MKTQSWFHPGQCALCGTTALSPGDVLCRYHRSFISHLPYAGTWVNEK